MPKRTAEQALRDEYGEATKERDRQATRLDAAKERTKAAIAAQDAVNKAHQEAISRRIRATNALEALLTHRIEEEANGDEAAPATTGANDEVLSDRKDAKK